MLSIVELAWLLASAFGIIKQWILVPPRHYPPNFCDEVKQGDAFDYIVVGAGSAGATVARGLAETNPKWTVLLVEAGDNPLPTWEVPLSTYFPPLKTWGYTSSPSKTACLGSAGGKCTYIRSKTLGGCSNSNFMMYSRGNRKDYDEWEEMGNKGWSYKDVLPFFKKLEDFLALPIEDSQTNKTVNRKYHSKGGRLTVNHFKKDPVSYNIKKAILEAGKSIGLKMNSDYNGESQIGMSERQFTVDRDYRRQSTAKAFLQDVPKNLKVCKEALVDRVLIKNRKAQGIIFSYNGKSKSVFAKMETILSAGAFGTPAILERSGVGHPELLKRLNITVVHKLPGVGANLQDHFYIPGHVLKVKKPFAEGPYNPLSMSLLSFEGYFDTLNNSSVPDVQLYFDMLPPLTVAVYAIANYALMTRLGFATAFPTSYSLMATPAFLQTDIPGSVHIISKDPNDHPDIQIKHFSTDKEIQTMLRGIHLINKMLEQNSMKKFELRYVKHYKKCAHEKFKSDGYYICLMKNLATSLYHPSCTCKMGPRTDATAVVNNKLQVYGIDNLMIADASIMPKVTRGNTNGPTIMIAKRAVDFIGRKYRE